jgi:hypothetical protein
MEHSAITLTAFGQSGAAIQHSKTSTITGKGPSGSSRETSQIASITHLDTPSKTNGLDGSCPQSLELLQGGRRIREQIQACPGVLADLDAPIVDPIINPVRRNVKFLGELSKGERACYAAWMRLMAH